MLRTVSCLYDMYDKAASADGYEASFDAIRDAYGKLVNAHNGKAAVTRGRMDNMFSFADSCWGDGNEMLMIVTELTADPECVSFISDYGCEGYYEHNKNLLFDERSIEIQKKINELRPDIEAQ